MMPTHTDIHNAYTICINIEINFSRTILTKRNSILSTSTHALELKCQRWEWGDPEYMKLPRCQVPKAF